MRPAMDIILGIGRESAITEVTREDIIDAFINRWANGTFCWWCSSPCGGAENRRATKEGAVADFLAWVAKVAPKQRANCEDKK